MQNFKQAMYASCVDDFAREYAMTLNPGNPILGGFDRERYDKDIAAFKERIDTPDKLMQFVEALVP